MSEGFPKEATSLKLPIRGLLLDLLRASLTHRNYFHLQFFFKSATASKTDILEKKVLHFFWKRKGEERRGGGLRSLFPSEMQKEELLPTSRALKVKRKNGTSQRPKKNDILLVTTPSARGFVVGASAFNWKQVQCFCAQTHVQ